MLDANGVETSHIEENIKVINVIGLEKIFCDKVRFNGPLIYSTCM